MKNDIVNKLTEKKTRKKNFEERNKEDKKIRCGISSDVTQVYLTN